MALTDNILAYYKFDENAGTIVSDATGNGNTGTYNGTWGSGIINSGLNLAQASSNKVDIGGFNNIINYGSFSVQAWCNFTSFPSDSRVVCNAHTDANSVGFQLYTANSGGLQRIRYNLGLSSNVTAEGTIVVGTGSFYHFVGVYDGGTVIIYANGTNVGTHAGSGTIKLQTSDVWISGNPDYNGDFMNGTCDEVALWNRALSAAEVTTLYNGGAGLQYPFTTGNPIQGFKTLLGLGQS